jgi:hypothetical protein
MGKTYREISSDILLSRSVSYKSPHSPYSRGGRKKRDRSAWATQRNQNRCIEDETQYIDFAHAKKKRRNVNKNEQLDPHKYDRLDSIIEEHGWANVSLEDNLIAYIQLEHDDDEDLLKDERFRKKRFSRNSDYNYLKKCLKQVQRRGNTDKFIEHDISFKYDMNNIDNMESQFDII